MTDDDSKRWNDTFNQAERSMSPPAGTRAPAMIDPKQLGNVLSLTKALGLEVINLVAEIRSMNRLVRVGIVVGFVTCMGFLGGAYVQWIIHQEQQGAQDRNRRQLKAQIAAATREIGRETESARAAAENAAKRAQHAAAESIAAQIEAAEVQMRILPPRERAEVAERIKERKKTQKQLSSEL